MCGIHEDAGEGYAGAAGSPDGNEGYEGGAGNEGDEGGAGDEGDAGSPDVDPYAPVEGDTEELYRGLPVTALILFVIKKKMFLELFKKMLLIILLCV
jgi:hypothetical protein